MSKAFTRESDEPFDEPTTAARPNPLPPGVKNYITSDGARQLQADLDHCLRTIRPGLLSEVASNDQKSRLQRLDQRIRQWQETLATVVVVDPSSQDKTSVRFGATVTVRNRSGESLVYRIVGVNEIDLDKDWVSWISPIARALIGARVGETVRFRFPTGDDLLQILAIDYGTG